MNGQKMCYILTMKYYSALKEKEILPYTTTQMNLEDTMPTEINQSQNQYWRILLI